ncbi:NAD(P)/FAD-dependent oxidoreductase [Lyngbya sp. PCC 8106]|uniref:NAD(P)/FAD-dependent oxidoreductase n=1 Tax=Lyngbya sp. (strain PCC 8106) TaxID=313612 RepID=UPI0000EAB6CB|nr:FAD-dependent oxidoreductase [Lyngbya sp. PCC 8106]EAW34460.1 FAD dependent oxidoreductase [Lyngbya sp. PCC 8106]
MTTVFDIAIIGAGFAGLIAAQDLKQAGYSVIVLEKSRGVGGRCATRRVSDICVDHGVRYLAATGEHTQNLIKQLTATNVLELWTDKIYGFKENQLQSLQPQSCYIAPSGMNSVGKELAVGLDIWFNRRVQRLTPTENKTWYLSLETTHPTATEKPQEVEAKAVILAIPAPQALLLLESLTAELPANFVEQVRSVEYDPCITAMAGYPENELTLKNFPEKAITFPEDEILAWVGLDSSKRLNPQHPVLVIQSSAKFAEYYLDTTDLQPVGELLLKSVSDSLSLGNAEWMQVHRWRYAFCRKSLSVSCLTTTIPSPLVCCGDWCGGNDNIETALMSGNAAVKFFQD